MEQRKYLKHGRANYDKQPFVRVMGGGAGIRRGWEEIVRVLSERIGRVGEGEGLTGEGEGRGGKSKVVVIDYYAGVHEEELYRCLVSVLPAAHFFWMGDIFRPPAEIETMTWPDVTEDAVFGYMTRLVLADFVERGKLEAIRASVAGCRGTVIVYGYGARLAVERCDLFLYADMPRRELQLRYRRGEVSNLGLVNKGEKASLQYKRGFFVDWRVLDRHKQQWMERWDYVLDTTASMDPRLVSGDDYRQGLRETVRRPFRVVPFFDPGPWGGQWMKEVCGLGAAANYAWCFDCVPEENSLLLRYGDVLFETPAINLVFYQSRALLGEAVQARFGPEFPIRFDFLDTMEGGNLSLQVHPTTEYIREHFGMCYTQDESYYFLDAGEGACVYLGLKEGADAAGLVAELEAAAGVGARAGVAVEVDKYVAKWAVKKHDHILIPAGTIHCSGRNSMVLEISATPYIFTFKLWDWGRMGLDGRPRPIHIGHGQKVIDRGRREGWVKDQLVNRISLVARGEGWMEERTGLHEREFIETRRHWFCGPVTHRTAGTVNVLNLVEGEEAVVESPVRAFEPFVVHYAETFIIPAGVGEYVIRPSGPSAGKTIATIKAYVRS